MKPLPKTWRQFLTPVKVNDVVSQPKPKRDATFDGESIADWYTDNHGWADVLEREGWTCLDTDADADGARWRHPTANNPYSATIKHGCLFVYSPNTPFKVTTGQSNKHGYTRFHAYAVLNHAGDQSAAAKHLYEQQHPQKTKGGKILPVAPEIAEGDADGEATGCDPVSLDDVEPVDGAALLDGLVEFLSRFIAYPSEHAAVAHALWIAHTWLMDCWDSTPRIAFLSPEPGSGKTRALEVSEPLVPNPIHSVNVTSAYLFRKIAEARPTLLYDEIDTVFGPKAKENEDIRAVINSGHRNGATAGRCTVRGKVIETEDLPSYCAVAVAGLNDLPDTIMDRSIVIRMRRRAPTEPVEPWRPRVNEPQAAPLRDQLARWAASVKDQAPQHWPNMPEDITDRSADCWEALLTVADLAGGHWAETARVTAVTVVTESREQEPSLGVMLLRDVKTIFTNRDAVTLATIELLTDLRGMEDAPWKVLGKDGKGLDARGLAKFLRRYGIAPKPTRIMGQVVKGYERQQFADAWLRYPAPDDAALLSEKSVTSVTDGYAAGQGNG